MDPHRFGDLDLSDEFGGADPVQDYIDHKRSHGVSPGTIRSLDRRLHSNQNGTAMLQYFEREGIDITDGSVADFRGYREYLRDLETISEQEIKSRFTDAASMMAVWMMGDITDANPASYILQTTDFDIDSPDRVEIPVDVMAAYVHSIGDPLFQAMAVCFLKWGARRAEVINLDLQCVHIDDERYHEYLAERGIELHDAVKDRPDSVLIYGGYSEGDTVNGEVRQIGTRRTEGTVVPLDAETKWVLQQWLPLRPLTGEPHPVFTQLSPQNGSFGRVKPSMVYRRLIRTYAVEAGIATESADREDVDLHYFRHWFGEQMRRHHGSHDGGLDRDLVKYIRGDVIAGDTLEEHYTHNWNVTCREPYTANIYTFGLLP